MFVQIFVRIKIPPSTIRKSPKSLTCTTHHYLNTSSSYHPFFLSCLQLNLHQNTSRAFFQFPVRFLIKSLIRFLIRSLLRFLIGSLLRFLIRNLLRFLIRSLFRVLLPWRIILSQRVLSYGSSCLFAWSILISSSAYCLFSSVTSSSSKIQINPNNTSENICQKLLWSLKRRSSATGVTLWQSSKATISLFVSS